MIFDRETKKVSTATGLKVTSINATAHVQACGETEIEAVSRLITELERESVQLRKWRAGAETERVGG